jgi:hypothetical protein
MGLGTVVDLAMDVQSSQLSSAQISRYTLPTSVLSCQSDFKRRPLAINPEERVTRRPGACLGRCVQGTKATREGHDKQADVYNALFISFVSFPGSSQIHQILTESALSRDKLL